MNMFNPLDVKPGEKQFGYVDVVDNLAVNIKMPFGVVNGVKSGPTLIVTGGLYPTEYCGVEAASRLYQMLEPEKLRGRFISVPVMNMHSFQWRTRWMNLRSTGSTPYDGKNVNSVMPGDPDGTLSDRIAYTLFQVLKKCDYHVDFRGGDLPESHLVHTIQLRVDAEIDNVTEEMAKVFGLEYVLPGTPKIGHTSPGTMIHEAVQAGVASIISEAGLGYRTQPLEEFIMNHVDGTLNLLKHYDMIDGDPVKPKNQRYLDMEWVGVAAPEAGVFHAIADYGDILTDGQLIGKITDLDGSTLAEITSPIDGVVHTMYPARLVFPGDRLYTLLRIDEPTGW
ncbi:MAG: succinylglutamate desuccinylase/aspartoacylase family protein [Candidatus Bathyarchaeota archaeon]|nr:succinylglutamate desuccinylase/aspartoacylase family protein [Candidatus Bathyarchaeota archaeon]